MGSGDGAVRLRQCPREKGSQAAVVQPLASARIVDCHASIRQREVVHPYTAV